MSKISDYALWLRDVMDDATDDFTATAIQLNTEHDHRQVTVAGVDEHGDMLLIVVKQAPTCGVCCCVPSIRDDATIMCACGDWQGRWA